MLEFSENPMECTFDAQERSDLRADLYYENRTLPTMICTSVRRRSFCWGIHSTRSPA